MVLVDSSVWIESSRRKGRLDVKVALEELLKVHEATWCGVVRLEVLAHARQQDRKAMSAYFSIVPYVQIGAKTWHSAQMLCWKLKDTGLTIPMGDALMAALAIEHDCRLYAADEHFEKIAKHVPLHLYSPGYGGGYDAGEK